MQHTWQEDTSKIRTIESIAVRCIHCTEERRIVYGSRPPMEGCHGPELTPLLNRTHTRDNF